MPAGGWPAAGQTKIRCKLGIQRIRTVIGQCALLLLTYTQLMLLCRAEKNEALAKRSRREVATLLEAGKVETARIRTESLILQDTHNEL